MGGVKERLSFKRKLIQLYAALLYNAHVRGYLEGDIYTGKAKMLCVPGLNCYSCPGAEGACPLGALQNALASSGNRAPYYMLGILLLFGMTLGRTICGWLCPAGLVQELLYKIPTPKVKKSRATRILSYLKYIILSVFVVAIPLIYAIQNVPVPAFCKYICPAGTLGGAVQLLAHPANADKFSMLGIFFTRKWVVLMALAAASVFIFRAFCRFICPLGAIYGLFDRFALAGIRVNDDRCIHCGKCVAHCPMDVKKVCDRECISCGKCIGICPTNAISLRAGKIVIFGETNEADKISGSRPAGSGMKKAAAASMAVLLAGALVFTNLPDRASGSASSQTAADAASGNAEGAVAEGAVSGTGHEVGQMLPDFTIATISGDTFQLSDHQGKTVVINLWATWCTPCVNELPYFEKLKQAHPDDVVILAIHSDLVTDDVEEYLSGYDYTFSFAIDRTGDLISSLGGSTMLPQTLVLNADGVVTYNRAGSVTYERLEELVRAGK